LYGETVDEEANDIGCDVNDLFNNKVVIYQFINSLLIVFNQI
jgi:hypothetical protein